jgi:asparagine synthase (glutamine-hydrolysing)
MAGIVGIEGEGEHKRVGQMLERIAHRGESGSKIIERNGATLGAVWPEAEVEPTPRALQQQAAWDGSRPSSLDPFALQQERRPFALTAAMPDGICAARDPLGVCPLYYGKTDNGALCFASEVKALLDVAQELHEFPPGTRYDGQEGFQPFYSVKRGPELSQHQETIATQLRLRLKTAVCRRIGDGELGCWLSGGVASKSLAALARPHVDVLHTFAVGTLATPDLAYARRAASLLETEHHEITISLEEVLAPLPAVIWHLESFDVPLVRSSVTRYLAAERASDYVGSMLFDEGATELFRRCGNLREAAPADPADEMAENAKGLHNPVLQRVDRSASSHGLVGHVPYFDLDVFEYAMIIPADLKLRHNGRTVDQWILRQAMTGVLPEDELRPYQVPLWRGAGVGLFLALGAEDQITDEEFHRERVLPNGWILDGKEALMYYRIFREYFGELEDLSWMGRTTAVIKQRCGAQE